MRTRIEPSVATPHDLDSQLLLLQIVRVDRGDLEFSAGGGLDRGCDIANLIVVKIKTRDRVVALRRSRLFLDAERTLVGIELDDAITLRIRHVIRKHRRARIARCGAAHQRHQIMAIENVIAEHERTRITAHERTTENERLRQSIRTRLHAVREIEAPARTVTE